MKKIDPGTVIIIGNNRPSSMIPFEELMDRLDKSEFNKPELFVVDDMKRTLFSEEKKTFQHTPPPEQKKHRGHNNRKHKRKRK